MSELCTIYNNLTQYKFTTICKTAYNWLVTIKIIGYLSSDTVIPSWRCRIELVIYTITDIHKDVKLYNPSKCLEYQVGCPTFPKKRTSYFGHIVQTLLPHIYIYWLKLNVKHDKFYFAKFHFSKKFTLPHFLSTLICVAYYFCGSLGWN